jgi:CRP/FNR family cyclic AMP-dependent transcriptional regulator
MQRPMLAGAALARRSDGRTDAAEWTNVLADVPIFAGLPKRHLRKVAETAKLARFHDGTAIVSSGQLGETLYVVLDGEVTVRRPGLPALRLGIGSFFGEMALLDGGPRSATVVAKGPVVALAITRQRFLKVLRAEPAIAIGLLEEMTRRLRAVQASA